MTPAGIEPVNFRFVAQHLNNCAIAVPIYIYMATVQPHISESRLHTKQTTIINLLVNFIIIIVIILSELSSNKVYITRKTCKDCPNDVIKSS